MELLLGADLSSTTGGVVTAGAAVGLGSFFIYAFKVLVFSGKQSDKNYERLEEQLTSARADLKQERADREADRTRHRARVEQLEAERDQWRDRFLGRAKEG